MNPSSNLYCRNVKTQNFGLESENFVVSESNQTNARMKKRCISYHIISYIISYHIISYHIISYHIISYHISYHIMLYHIIYHIISYHILLFIHGSPQT